jgi:hypothetical protein
MSTTKEPSFVLKVFEHDGKEIEYLKELPYFPQIILELKRILGGVDPRNNTVVFKLPARCNISNILSVLRLCVPSNAGLEEMA